MKTEFEWPLSRMICTPRSGSTWLCQLLNGSQGLPLDFKLYAPRGDIWGEHFNTECRSDHYLPADQPQVSKVHANWLVDLPPLPPETKIISLKRSLESQSRSRAVGMQTRQSHVTCDEEQTEWLEKAPLTVTAQDVMRERHCFARMQAKQDAFCRDFPDVYDTHYESWMQAPLDELQKLCLWLGVPVPTKMPEVEVRCLREIQSVRVIE